MDMERCLLFERKLPNSFWAEAMNNSVYLLNRLPTKAVKGMRPLKLVVKISKLERSLLGIFVSYSNNKKGYRIFDPFTNKVFVRKDVKFNEGSAWNWGASEDELLE
ncbi:pleiotropic drug resistance protein 3-like [Gossypium australe]|uniref:Pleiotropic drug resistance protein 3-like n=1 Tax=Gossypium australe TaxID=47621 RepID=A0A5B6X152_9ROSI|nr:pleiotropic drug resistance protein 3-like [Gossypium australe]